MGDLFAVVDGAAANAAPFLVVEVPCVPRGKGRPRFANKGKFVSVYTDKKDVEYEKMIAGYAVKAMRGKAVIPAGFAVGLRIFAMIPVPKSWSRRDRDAALSGQIHPTSKPDWDNYGKSVSDAFNEVVWTDDAQATRSLVVKEYGEKPGLIIEVYLI